MKAIMPLPSCQSEDVALDLARPVRKMFISDDSIDYPIQTHLVERRVAISKPSFCGFNVIVDDVCCGCQMYSMLDQLPSSS